MSEMYSAPTTSLSIPGFLSKDRRGSCQNCRKYMSRVKSWKDLVNIEEKYSLILKLQLTIWNACGSICKWFCCLFLYFLPGLNVTFKQFEIHYFKKRHIYRRVDFTHLCKSGQVQYYRDSDLKYFIQRCNMSCNANAKVQHCHTGAGTLLYWSASKGLVNQTVVWCVIFVGIYVKPFNESYCSFGKFIWQMKVEQTNLIYHGRFRNRAEWEYKNSDSHYYWNSWKLCKKVSLKKFVSPYWSNTLLPYKLVIYTML